MTKLWSRVVFVGYLVAGLAATPAVHAEETKEEPGRPRVLVVPPAAIGEVSAVQLKRIGKGVADQLKTSSVFDVVTDKDKVAQKTDGKKNAPKTSAASKRIDAADAVRQEGMNLQTEGKWKDALDKFGDAVSLYEKAYLELQDYGNLASAYTGAGVAAFYAGRPAAEVAHWFEQGIGILPTLVIDRRKQDKALLELFDKTHEQMEKMPKLSLAIDGPTTDGVEAYVDGVKVGALPAKANELVPGVHYAQIHGEGFVPWGAIVHIRGKDAKVTAKVAAIKVEEKKVEVPVTVDSLADCARFGGFHLPVCKGPSPKLARQVGANFFVFSAIKLDRFNRPTLHAFVMDTGDLLTVSVKPQELAADLGDLNKKMADLEADVSKAVENFPKARAMQKTPAAWSTK
jgi:hypothetical protein